MRPQGTASASSNQPRARGARRGASSFLVALVCLLGGAFQVSPAAAACPNEVFRTGPSAKLPECRAYELVSPPYTGGLELYAGNFSNIFHGFSYPLINAGGDSVIFNTIGGSLGDTPGAGINDRYQARRTATGWKTELVGPTAAQTPKPAPGGVSFDHQYFFVSAGQDDFLLEPDAILQAPYGGKQADFLHKPNGDFELIAKGSLGAGREAQGRYIAPGGTHVIFTTETQLEPEAPPTGTLAIYDRTPGGPTHVVSLLPGNVTPTEGMIEFLGASDDGRDVAFASKPDPFSMLARMYVRHDNAVTKEVVRANGVVIGKELTCEGSGGPSITYQWLRDGAPIAGASDATYTTTGADQHSALQCQVSASSGEGESIQASLPPMVVGSYEGDEPPYIEGSPASVPTAHEGFATVGEFLTCEPGGWERSPTFSYRWFRNGVEIPGATSATYTTVGADDGKALQCRLAATNADGTTIGFSELIPVHPAPPATTAVPTIGNLTDPGEAPEAGDELSCSEGTWTGAPTFTYQWLRNGVEISGGTGNVYTVAFPADEGATLQCAVEATTPGGVAQAITARLVAEPSPGTAPPEADLSNPPGMIFGGGGEVGETLFCSAGTWSGEPTIGFQWLRDGAEIAGETNEAYVPTSADLGSVLQCRVVASNDGGSTVVTYSGADLRPRYGRPSVPVASAAVPTAELVFAGLRGGQVFYGDKAVFGALSEGDMYSFDIASGATTRITDVGDAAFSYVSEDGSRAFFLSQSQIGGEGVAGESNLYVWSRSDGSTRLIATVEPNDRSVTGLGWWTRGVGPLQISNQGLATANARSTPDGSIFLFETTAQLTSFDNTEAAPEDCGEKFLGGERCPEAYIYDANSEQLTCVSCPPSNSGPATGGASLVLQEGATGLTALNPPANLTLDGSTVFFESTEDLLPQDTNGVRDVYRWKQGAGLALISTGQQTVGARIWAITPNGSDVAFLTTERLLPEDRNGGTGRIYDARVNGGFPPPEDTVTEPCTGDICQGSGSAAPLAPSVGTSSLSGGGNVRSKLHCPKGKRRVVQHGKERCLKRKHRKHKKHGRRAGHKRGAAR